jgi:hypothetical protein
MKTDYQKGITSGLNLIKKHPSFMQWSKDDIKTVMQKLEDNYRNKIGNQDCPISGESASTRVSWYCDGIRDALLYGHGEKFVVAKTSSTGFYRVDDLIAELPVYNDPALACKRALELDPKGKYKGIYARRVEVFLTY